MASGIVIPPGDSAFIDVTYRSSKSTKNTRQVTKRISVHSNDSSNPVASLTIIARANMSESKFTWNPDQADFDQVLIGKGGNFKLELQNTDSTEMRLEVVSEPDPLIVKKYKIKKDKLKPNQTTEIEFELNNDLPPGAFKTALTVQRQGDDGNRLSIPITGTVVEKIMPVSPMADAKKKPAIKNDGSKPKTDAKPKADIQVKDSKTPDRVETKPAAQPVPLGTVDDSDLK